MAADRPQLGNPVSRLIHTTCPNCQHNKALVVAAYFKRFNCFCPACEHAWDCDDTLTNQPSL